MFTFGLAQGPKAFDPLILLLLAMALEGVAGFARTVFTAVPSPLSMIAGLARFFDRKLNRERRSQTDRAIRGVLVTLVILGLCGGISVGVLWLAGNVSYGWVLELVLTAGLLSQRQAFDRARDTRKALSSGDLEKARRLAAAGGRDGQGDDRHALCRGTIETMTETFVTGVVSPVFWFVLFGFPGLLISRAVQATASVLDRPADHYRAFGLTAGRLNDALLFIPARLASLFIAAAAAFTPTARPGQAMKTMGRDGGKHASLNLGWPVAAMAGALALSLTGVGPGRHRTATTPWIGDGTARAVPQDIGRALYVYGVACLLNLAGIAALAVIRYGTPG
jgi:adenosylcobinamide-phosphate synthase